MSIAKRAGSYQGQVGQLEGFNEPCTKMPSLSDLSAREISVYYSSGKTLHKDVRLYPIVLSAYSTW